VCICNSSYVGGMGRRIMVEISPGQNSQDLSDKKWGAEDLGLGSGRVTPWQTRSPDTFIHR
jgi:hypothetical protein